MSRLVPALCAACAIGIGITAWSRLDAGTNVDIPKTAGSKPAGAARDSLRGKLDAARRACDVGAFADVLAEAQRRTQADPEDADGWRLLAEVYLERAQQRTHLCGVKVGRPTFDELPAELADDVDEGLAAVAKAKQCGDESGDVCRIEASLMSQRITGFTTALQWNGRIGRALELAAARAGDDPRLHTALGLQKLLSPPLFGQDVELALEHFEFAVKASDDERPAVFAGMASFLQKKRQQAISWLERAVERNPNNQFARVCLRRLRRGEEDPFGRDVTAEEIAAAK